MTGEFLSEINVQAFLEQVFYIIYFSVILFYIKRFVIDSFFKKFTL